MNPAISEVSTPELKCAWPLFARDGAVTGYMTIDRDDMEWVRQWKWHLSSRGYAGRSVYVGNRRGRTILLHRELLALASGDGRQGDHINGDRLDNRRANLRVTTRAGNQQNRSPEGNATYGGKPTTSRFRGVTRTASGMWQARVCVDGTVHRLGHFKTEVDAAAAAREFRKTHAIGARS